MGGGHHLNQGAAFRTAIPYRDGLMAHLPGNVFTEPGSPHYNAHQSMEAFWDKYRRGGPYAGRNPTLDEYNYALRQSLLAAGLPPVQAHQLADLAKLELEAHGLYNIAEVPFLPTVPNVPRPISSVRNPRR